MSDLPGFASGEREPNFDRDAAIGYQGEAFNDALVDALVNGSSEVKTDERAAETGNIYIETNCRLRSGWARSGIAATSSAVWCHVIGGSAVMLVFAVDVLREALESCERKGWARPVDMPRGSHPTKGYVVPWDALIKECLLVRKRTTRATAFHPPLPRMEAP